MKTNSNGNVLFILSSSERDNELKAVFGMYDICTSIEHMPAVGIHKAVEEDYDIIFIEDFFQDMSGMAIANDILTQKDIFIYILASHMADVSIIGAISGGIYDYISKKSSALQLAVRCSALLERLKVYHDAVNAHRFEIDEDVISAGSISLNTRNGNVKVGRGPIRHLKCQEMKVLQFLMENPGRELSRKEIFENAWGEAYYEGENSVPSHITKIRKVIEENPKEPRFIISKWKYGYMFQAV